MQWRSNREKQLGVEFGFVVAGGTGRDCKIVNLIFDDKDVDHNSPRQGNVRPASTAEAKMWRKLLNAEA